MPKEITDGSSDPRIGKSKRDIRNALLDLISENGFEEIRVKEICERAPANKKTFYKYYASKEDVLDDVRSALIEDLEESLKTLDKSDLAGGLLVFYKMLETDDIAYHKLFFDDEYIVFFTRFKFDFFSLDFFVNFCKKPSYRKLIPGYMGAAEGLYREWKKKPGKLKNIDDLSRFAAEMLLSGLRAFES